MAATLPPVPRLLFPLRIGPAPTPLPSLRCRDGQRPPPAGAASRCRRRQPPRSSPASGVRAGGDAPHRCIVTGVGAARPRCGASRPTPAPLLHQTLLLHRRWCCPAPVDVSAGVSGMDSGGDEADLGGGASFMPLAAAIFPTSPPSGHGGLNPHDHQSFPPEDVHAAKGGHQPNALFISRSCYIIYIVTDGSLRD